MAGVLQLFLPAVVLAAAIHALLSYGVLKWPTDWDTQWELPSLLPKLPPACGHLHATEFAITSSRVVLRSGVHSAAVYIKDGKITRVAKAPLDRGPIAPHTAASVWLDYGNAIISPGLIDTHVHLDEPGREEWEGIECGTKAAAAGGVTTLVDMPLNSAPAATTGEILQRKVDLLKEKARVDVAVWAGLVPDNAHNASVLQGLLDAGARGFKSFMSPSGLASLIEAGLETGLDFGQIRRKDIEAALPFMKAAGVPFYVHAELPDDEDAHPEGPPRKYSTYLASRPPAWESRAIAQLIEILEADTATPAASGFRVHIAHLANADEIATIKAARARGLPITVETCPHYLHFSAEDVPDGDTRFKCAPPIRESKHREGLWKGLEKGDIDMVATDHSPALPELKLFEAGDFVKAWGGISGLQYALPSTWAGMVKRGLGPEKLARWWSEAPAQLAGVAASKGAIAAGMDADLVVWDDKALADTSPESNLHKHPATPYASQKLPGRVLATYVRGQLVFKEGAGVAPAKCGSALLP